MRMRIGILVLILVSMAGRIPVKADWELGINGELGYVADSVLGENTEIGFPRTTAITKEEYAIQKSVNAAGTKLRFDTDKDLIRMQAIMKDGKTKELGEQQRFMMKSKDGDIELRASSEGKMQIIRREIGSESSQPVFVDLVKREISLASESGTTKVRVLPDAAIERLIKNGIIQATRPGSLKLEVENGQAIYRLEGLDKKKFLGVFPIRRAIKLSAETGEATNSAKTRLEILRDLFSF